MKNGYEAWLDNPNHGLDHLSGWKIQLWDALPRHSRGCRLAHPSARLAHSLGGSLRFHPGPMRLMLKMRWQLRCEQSPATALPLPRFSVVVSNWSSSVSKRAVFKNTWSTRDWSICRFVSCSFCHALATPVLLVWEHFCCKSLSRRFGREHVSNSFPKFCVFLFRGDTID